MGWQLAVEQTVTGLGFELVECERGSQGLVRVTIDRLPGGTYPEPGEHVTVGDCERVTRQLQRVLEVEAFDYGRLEVSSPGLDRLLRTPAQWLRFAGSEVDVTLKLPFQGRKKYRGVLRAASADAGEAFELLFAADDGSERVLGFTLDEVREGRLVPVIDFKSRSKSDKKLDRSRGRASTPQKTKAQSQRALARRPQAEPVAAPDGGPEQ